MGTARLQVDAPEFVLRHTDRFSYLIDRKRWSKNRSLQIGPFQSHKLCHSNWKDFAAPAREHPGAALT